MGSMHINHDAPDNVISSFAPTSLNQAMDARHALRCFCFKEQSRQDSQRQLMRCQLLDDITAHVECS